MPPPSTRSSTSTNTLSDDPPSIPLPSDASTSASSSGSTTNPPSSPPHITKPIRMSRPLFPSRLPPDQLDQLLSFQPHKTQLPSEVDEYAYREQEMYDRQEEQERRSSAIPEKCLTFCSQRADAPPMCRMFCLRKRKPLETREEALARLRPPRSSAVHVEAKVATTTPGLDRAWQPCRYFFPSSGLLLPPIRPATASSSPPTSSEQTSSPSISHSSNPIRQSWSPFEALRRRVEPYSFVSIRGAPDGPVGRYMEELEYDDGNSDFGMASRGAGDVMKRKRYQPKIEYIDWGEEGSILSIPFTSIFGPIIAIPENLKRIFGPSTRFLTLYRDSFTSGAQVRNLEKFQHELSSGSAFQMLGKFQAYWARRVKAKEEELERERAQKVGKGE